MREFNSLKAPAKQEYVYKDVDLVLKDQYGKVFGGLLAKIYRGCLFIDVFWVCESQRGLGYGGKLLEEVETIASREKCSFIHLDTFNFQAPEFYIKNGYEIYGVLDSYSDGIKRYYLKKEL